MTTSHPYESLEGSELWLIVEKALDDLIENQYVILCTPKAYVIGYIVKSLSMSGVNDA
jgi:hypothetical protein